MNRQRVLSLLLALVMVLGSFGIVAASEANKSESNDAKIQWLQDQEIVVGRKVNENAEDNDLALDENVTRAEITKLIVHTIGQADLAEALDGVVKPFPDVERTHWANGFISVAVTERASNDNNANGLIIGYEDGEFKPSRDVTYAELATMLVRLVKDDLTKADEDKAIWATDYMRWAEEEGILHGIKVADSNAKVDRYDAFVMIYNAMEETGRIKDNEKAEFGDDLGIISRVGDGKVEINQDKVYNITWDTMLSRGTTWNEVANNLDRNLVGSLVRFITDKDNNVTHMIVLGQDGQAIDNRWDGVADSTKSGVANISDRYDNADIRIDGVQAKINDNTRIFVADVDQNALKEVEALSDIFRLFINRTDNIDKVYMGYDTNAGRNVAKVVVFGDVEKYQGLNDVRRITRFLNTNREFMGEDTKGVETRYSIAKTTGFPQHDYVDVKDVVRVRDGHWEIDPAEVLIDYSDDNVYQVVDLFDDNHGVELKDEYGNRRQFYIDEDTDIFTEKQFKEGVNVQVVIGNDNDLEIISVVDKALDGELPEGVFVGSNTGFLRQVVNAEESAIAKGYQYMARFTATENGSGTTDYYVSALDGVILETAVEDGFIDRELNFEVKVEDGLQVAYRFDFTQAEYNRIAELFIENYRESGEESDRGVAQFVIGELRNAESNKAARQSELDVAIAEKAVEDAEITATLAEDITVEDATDAEKEAAVKAAVEEIVNDDTIGVTVTATDDGYDVTLSKNAASQTVELAEADVDLEVAPAAQE